LNIGKLIRLNRSSILRAVCALRSITSSRMGRRPPVRNTSSPPWPIAAGPDADQHKGIATSCWEPYRPYPTDHSKQPDLWTIPRRAHRPEEAIRLGADALAVAAFVRGRPRRSICVPSPTWCGRDALSFRDLSHLPETPGRRAPDLFEPEDIAWLCDAPSAASDV
jgi:hypothetical protein